MGGGFSCTEASTCRDDRVTKARKQRQVETERLSRWGRLKAVTFGNSTNASAPPVICNCRTGVECTGEDKHPAVMPKSQLRLHLMSAKRIKESSSDGKQSHFLQGREAW